jgi:hypothetical protein
MMHDVGLRVAQKLLKKYDGDVMSLYYISELIKSLQNNEEISESAISKLFFEELTKELSKKE